MQTLTKDVAAALLKPVTLCGAFPRLKEDFEKAAILQNGKLLPWYEYDLWVQLTREFLDSCIDLCGIEPGAVMQLRRFMLELATLRRQAARQQVFETIRSQGSHRIRMTEFFEQQMKLVDLELFGTYPFYVGHQQTRIKNYVDQIAHGAPNWRFVPDEAGVWGLLLDDVMPGSQARLSRVIVERHYQADDSGDIACAYESADEELKAVAKTAIEAAADFRGQMIDQLALTELRGGSPGLSIETLRMRWYIDDYFPHGCFEEHFRGRLEKGIDGRSFGLPLALAALQLLNWPAQPVDSWKYIAATGRIINRTGTVGDVGGVSAKVSAALRSGATKLLIPNANVDEAQEALTSYSSADEMKLEIIGVESLTDAVNKLYRFSLPAASKDSIFLNRQNACQHTPNGFFQRETNTSSWQTIGTRREFIRDVWEETQALTSRFAEGPSLDTMVVIHGPPKSGKSIFALRWARDLAQRGFPVLFIEDSQSIDICQIKNAATWCERPLVLFVDNAEMEFLSTALRELDRMAHIVLVLSKYDGAVHEVLRTSLPDLQTIDTTTKVDEVRRALKLSSVQMPNGTTDVSAALTQLGLEHLRQMTIVTLSSIAVRGSSLQAFSQEKLKRIRGKLAGRRFPWRVIDSVELYDLVAAFSLAKVSVPIDYIIGVMLKDGRCLTPFGRALLVAPRRLRSRFSRLLRWALLRKSKMSSSSCFELSETESLLGLAKQEEVVYWLSAEPPASEQKFKLELRELFENSTYRERKFLQFVLKSGHVTLRRAHLISDKVYKHVRQIVTDLIADVDSDDSELMYWAMTLRSMRWHEEAVLCLIAYLDRNPSSADFLKARHLLAMTYKDLGALANALQELTDILDADPDDYVALCHYLSLRAQVPCSLNELEKTQEDVEQLLQSSHIPGRVRISAYFALAQAAESTWRSQPVESRAALAGNIMAWYEAADDLAQGELRGFQPSIRTAEAGFLLGHGPTGLGRARELLESVLNQWPHHTRALFLLLKVYAIQIHLDRETTRAADRAEYRRQAIRMVDGSRAYLSGRERYTVDHELAIISSLAEDWWRYDMGHFWRAVERHVRAYEDCLIPEADLSMSTTDCIHNASVMRSLGRFAWHIESHCARRRPSLPAASGGSRPILGADSYFMHGLDWLDRATDNSGKRWNDVRGKLKDLTENYRTCMSSSDASLDVVEPFSDSSDLQVHPSVYDLPASLSLSPEDVKALTPAAAQDKLAEVERILAKDQEHFKALWIRGSLKERLGSHRDALKDFLKSAKLQKSPRLYGWCRSIAKGWNKKNKKNRDRPVVSLDHIMKISKAAYELDPEGAQYPQNISDYASDCVDDAMRRGYVYEDEYNECRHLLGKATTVYLDSRDPVTMKKANYPLFKQGQLENLKPNNQEAALASFRVSAQLEDSAMGWVQMAKHERGLSGNEQAVRSYLNKAISCLNRDKGRLTQMEINRIQRDIDDVQLFLRNATEPDREVAPDQ